MEENSGARQAQLALVKLLSRLRLLPENPPKFTSSDLLPLAYYAKHGAYAEPEALRAVAAALGIPLFSINKATIRRYMALLGEKPFDAVPLRTWQALRAMPIECAPGHVLVAMANPLDHDAKTSLEFIFGVPVHLGVAREEEILSVILGRFNNNESLELGEFDENAPPQPQAEEGGELDAAKIDVSAPPVVRLVDKILSEAIQAGASDIHITPENDALHVRVRVDGILRPLLAVQNTLKNHVLSRLKLLAGMDIAERRRPQDGRIRLKTEHGAHDLRISTIPTIFGENMVARVLSTDFKSRTFGELGMGKDIEERFVRALKGSSRVVLVTGPTGSGKTSVLYTALLSLNDGKCSIVTVEDPVEYRVTGIRQLQVNQRIQLGFAEGLRSILRQDPDIIMVGEIRDQETASIALQSAQTGHLVLSTLHTNNAAGAVIRLRDLGAPAYLLASSLGCIVAARLVRKLCAECAKPATKELHDALVALKIDPLHARSAVGCPVCDGSGYAGRTGVFSFLEVTDEMRIAIRENRGEQELEACDPNFSPLQESALRLIEQGVTTLEEVEHAIGPVEAAARPRRKMRALNETADADGAQSDGLARRRVLLVEDDENTRVVLGMILRKEMFEVVEASDGAEGIEKVYEHAPEIIVCDLMMPGMSGTEMVQKLRRDPRTRTIPVLMLTAATSEENEVRSLDCGANDFVSKTASPKVMLLRLQRLLDRP